MGENDKERDGEQSLALHLIFHHFSPLALMSFLSIFFSQHLTVV